VAVPDLAFDYRYLAPSRITSAASRPTLSLVTTREQGRDARFFEGAILHPKRTADLLLAVIDVVQSRFHTPAAMLSKILRQADPVITCGREVIRFEGFSACCSVYARLDLLPGAIDGQRLGFGTTNVDVNAPMRTALKQVREGEPLGLEVSTGALTVHRETGTLLEKQVTLPGRWVRGFSEVQVAQAAMRPRFALSGVEFRRFLGTIPRSAKGVVWLSVVNGQIRLSSVRGHDAVPAGGLSRLRLLEPILRHASKVTIHAGDGASEGVATAWEIETPDSRLTVVLSPDVWRGFSGEGGVLDDLTAPLNERAAATIKGALRWHDAIDIAQLAHDSCLTPSEAQSALATFAVSGLVGFDLSQQSYFHRELPFRPERLAMLQPRLANAQRLHNDAAVRLDAGPAPTAAWVRSGDVEYRVILSDAGESCTCTWFARHGSSRGPCKHILAAKLAAGSNPAKGDGNEP
jgi:hypothetical protein